MRLSELQHKDIVDLEGRKIGNIIDVNVSENGKIISLVVEANKFIKFKSKLEDNEVPWEKITKIGQDVILVDI